MASHRGLELILVALRWSLCAARFVAVEQIDSPSGSIDGSLFGSSIVCVPDNAGNHHHLLVSSPSSDQNRVLSYDVDTLMNEQVLRDDDEFSNEFSDEYELAVNPSGSLVAVFSPSDSTVSLYELSVDHTFVPSETAPILNVAKSLSMLENYSSSSYDCLGSSMTMSRSYLAIKCVETFEVYDAFDFNDDEFDDLDFALIYEMSESGAFSDDMFARVYARATQSDDGSVRSISISDNLLIMADELANIHVFNNAPISQVNESESTERQWNYTQTLTPTDLISSPDIATSAHIVSLDNQTVLAQVVCSPGVLSVALWDSNADEGTLITFHAVEVSMSVNFDGFGLATPDTYVSLADSLIAVGVASTGNYFVELFDASRDEDAGKLVLTQPRDQDSEGTVSRIIEPDAVNMSEGFVERYFGTSVSLCIRNGERVLAVGAPSSIESESGVVYIFADTETKDAGTATDHANVSSTDAAAENPTDSTTFENMNQTHSPDANFTEDFNGTAIENMNQTHSPHANFTEDFNGTAIENMNQTQSPDANFTEGFNGTSNENGTLSTTDSNGVNTTTNETDAQMTTWFESINQTSSPSSNITSSGTPGEIYSTTADVNFTTTATNNSETDAGSTDVDSNSTEGYVFTNSTEGGETETAVASGMNFTMTDSQGFPGGETSGPQPSSSSNAGNSGTETSRERTKYPGDATTRQQMTDAPAIDTTSEADTATSLGVTMNGTFVGNGELPGEGTNQPVVVVDGDEDDGKGSGKGWPDEDVVIIFGVMFFMGIFGSLMCMCYRKCANRNRYVGLDARGGAGYVPPAPRRGSRTRRGDRRASYAELQGLNGSQRASTLPL